MAKKNKPKKAESWMEPVSFPRFESLWSKNVFNWPRYADLSLNKIPDVDMVDEGNSLKITVDLPGIRKEDIKLNVNKDSITISANTKKEKEAKGKNYYYSERASAGYYRRIPLPTSVNPGSSKAKLDNGSLEIKVRKEGKASGKTVSIG